MGLTIRTLTSEDVVPLRRVLAAAFLTDFDENLPERWEHVIEFDRTYGMYDGEELVGGGAVLSREITMPGGVTAPVAAMTAVGVEPGYQRRGGLTQLVKTLVASIDHEAFAVLWASEGSIYSQFGCGSLASDLQHVALPHGAAFHPGVDIGEARVREVPHAKALPALREIYDQVRRTHTGWLNRTERSWNFHLADEPHDRDGMSALRFALHPQGYAIYRVKTSWDDRGPQDELHVREIVGETDVAYAALYRHLLDLGLAGEVKYYTAPDDPIVHLLANPRLAIRKRADALWLRIVDLERALPLRHYLSDVDIVLEVTDRLCPWNDGRWRFTVENGRATVRKTTEDPGITTDIATLGSVFLGGTRLSVLARAQRVREHRPGAVRALSAAFLGEHEPHCPELF